MPFIKAFVLVLMMVASSCSDDDRPEPLLPTREITVEANGRSEQLTVELATTGDQRVQGLMFRQVLPEDAGMLFIFPRDVTGGFWMRNTYVPLTIAYLDADGRVLERKDGTPLDETLLVPSRPYRYVLEVNQGWFERHGLTGDVRVVLPDDLPPGE